MDLQGAGVGGISGAKDGHGDTGSAVPPWSCWGPAQGFDLPESPLWILSSEVSTMTLGAMDCGVEFMLTADVMHLLSSP